MGRRRSKTKSQSSKQKGARPAGAGAKAAASAGTLPGTEPLSSRQDVSSQDATAQLEVPDTEPPHSRITTARQPAPATGSTHASLRSRKGPKTNGDVAPQTGIEPAAFGLKLSRCAWVAALAACAFSFVPSMSLSATPLAASGPYAPHHGVVLLALGALAGLIGSLRLTLWPLLLLGVAACAFSLTGLEDRSLVSAFHRSVPRLFGVGPELWLCVAWGALCNTPAGYKGKLAAASVALMGFTWALLSPTPVGGDLVPGVLANAIDTVDDADRFGRTLLPWVHIAFAGLGFAACGSKRLRERLGAHGLLSLFAAWALVSGVLGSEGWVRPLWEFPVVSHLVVRTVTLCALALGVAQLLRRGSASLEQRHALPLLSGVVALCYLLVQSEIWHWSKADENVYFYAARALGDGVMPYADYFYAHPPLRVFLPGALYAVFGFSIWTAKLLPALSAVCSGWCVGRIVEETVDAPGRKWWGLVAMAAFLATERTLTASSEFSGVNLATALMSVALLLAYRGRPLASGILAASAQGVGMVVTWMLPVLLLVVWLRARASRSPQAIPSASSGGRLRSLVVRLRPSRPVLRLCAGWAGAALAVFGSGLLLGGDDFITQVFRYHSLKAAIYSQHVELGSNPLNWPVVAFKDLGLLIESDEIRKPIDNNLAAWLGGVVAAFALPWTLWLKRYGGKRAAREELPRLLANWLPLLVGGLLALLFMGLLKEIYRYYWAALIPMFTILAVLGLARIGKVMAARPLTAVAFGLLGVLLPARAFAHYGLVYPQSAEERYPGNVVEVPFRSTSPVPALDGVMASVFYKPFLVRSELEAALHRSYWAKKKELTVAQELADVINERVPAGRTITGSSTIAPLVALLANRRMADNQVDTNSKVLTSGLRDNRAFWKALCEDDVGAIVTGGGMFSDRYMAVGLPVRDQFEKIHRVHDAATQNRGAGLAMEVWALEHDREKCEL